MDLSKLSVQHQPDAAKSDIPWSPMQLEIFDFGKNTDDNLSIEAVAGSGKTTTLLEFMEICGTRNGLFLAFNKSIADELARKVPETCKASTFHSLGFSVLRSNTSTRYNVDGRKVNSILRTQFSKPKFEDIGYTCEKIVSALKNSLIHPQSISPEVVSHIIDNRQFDISMEDMTLVTETIADNYARCCDCSEGKIDFDDMVMQPLLQNMEFPKYDAIFVDEAQDLNYLQHQTLERLTENGARLIAVGDTYQAIYGFRGAKHDSMEILRETFKTELLPLSVSYRCPEKVIEVARGFVPHIRARDGAPLGEVDHWEGIEELSSVSRGDMVICRNNFPLFQLAMRFLRERIPVRLRTNHGKDLIGFVKRFDADSCADLRVKLQAWYSKEHKEASEKGKSGKLAFIEERKHIVLSFIDECTDVRDIINTLYKLLESKTGPILSTIHKAKGLEADTVFLLRPDLLPSKFAETDEQLQQERNLEYVAITRALSRLVYVHQE